MRLCLLSFMMFSALLVNGWAQSSIPPGSVMVVRTIDAIDSKTADAGKTFSASLDEPIVAGGKQLAPKGAEVLLKVVEARTAGKLTGNAELTVAIASVKIDSAVMPVETAEVKMQSEGKGKSTGKKIGILGAVGGTVGAIAGGGKGAAIGAAAGAAAGTGLAMATGPQVKIPSETRLTFTTR